MTATKRRSISPALRKALARRYGLDGPGKTVGECAYCCAPGAIEWVARRRIPAWHPWAKDVVRPATVYFEHHIEHRIPLEAGGTDDLENLTLACAPCNYRKGVGVCVDDSWMVGA